jgi:imidazolonepropionase-like amidohydrolase
VITTLSTPDGFIPGTGAALAADPRLAPFLSHYQRGRLTGEIASPLPGPTRQNIDADLAAVRSLVRAGVTILAGTDPPNGTVLHGVSLHRELELLVQGGMTPAQALTAATRNPAAAFHLRARGSIAVGKRADLVLVQGNPANDITATRDILRVWRSGVTVPRTPEER